MNSWLQKLLLGLNPKFFTEVLTLGSKIRYDLVCSTKLTFSYSFLKKNNFLRWKWKHIKHEFLQLNAIIIFWWNFFTFFDVNEWYLFVSNMMLQLWFMFTLNLKKKLEKIFQMVKIFVYPSHTCTILGENRYSKNDCIYFQHYRVNLRFYPSNYESSPISHYTQRPEIDRLLYISRRLFHLALLYEQPFLFGIHYYIVVKIRLKINSFWFTLAAQLACFLIQKPTKNGSAILTRILSTQ